MKRFSYRTHPKEYTSWFNMKQRCNNPKNPSYKDYGAKGISYPTEWESFESFLNDMGERPSTGYWSIDRIDCKKGYSKENCRWATRSQQNQNNNGNRFDNTSGKKGVHYDHRKDAFIAQWMENGKRRSKTFSVSKYGNELSELLACEYREHMLDFLNLNGNEYTESHR